MRRWLAYQETDRRTGATTSTADRKRKIRCPRCGWTPGRHDRWQCTCGHSWNTFDTRGVCPACLARWLETQCRRCHEWSPHDAWYVDEDEPHDD